MIKNETILASIYMIKDYKNGVHFLEETVDRVLNELKLLDAELEALQSRSCLSCTSCNKDTQLMSCPPQYTLSCGVFNTVFVNDFKQSCSRYEAKEQL